MRKYGVEIEFNADNSDRATIAAQLNQAGIHTEHEYYNHQTRSYWKVITDSSCGLELVSPILNDETSHHQITTACKTLQASGAKITKNCGIHVHFDVSDFTLENFKNLIKYWIKFEDVFDALQPTSRRHSNNEFCRSNLGDIQPTAESHHQACKQLFEKIDQTTTLNELAQLFPSRYVKMNIQSYFRHGTIEIRHHAGSLNPEKINHWITLMQQLFERAKTARCVKIQTESAYGRAMGYGIERLDSLYITLRLTTNHTLCNFFRERARHFAHRYGYGTATR